MGDISEISKSGRWPATIEVPPHWIDHHFQGQPVLPAVEVMQLLAHWVKRFNQQINSRTIAHARFDKFLPLTGLDGAISALYEITKVDANTVQATLMTRITGKSSKISRTIIHAQMDFSKTWYKPPLNLLELPAELEYPYVNVDPQRIYTELVPLGSRYRNITRPLQLNLNGALAFIQTPDLLDEQTTMPLGSPFVMDAAMHAACVWSQRFEGIVAFPVGLEKRYVLSPTRNGENYIARIFPKGKEATQLLFDILIFDGEGRHREALQGLRMRDVSGGRLKPPDWIRDQDIKVCFKSRMRSMP